MQITYNFPTAAKIVRRVGRIPEWKKRIGLSAGLPDALDGEAVFGFSCRLQRSKFFAGSPGALTAGKNLQKVEDLALTS
jgi:hypothetical protein